MEPVYESWAINRIVYSRVAATGLFAAQGKETETKQAPLAVQGQGEYTERQPAHMDARQNPLNGDYYRYFNLPAMEKPNKCNFEFS